jgi:hypothetical protein
MESKKYEEVLEKANRYFIEGRDEAYMKFQFAEQGLDDKIVDAVLLEIKKLKKGVNKNIGSKLLICGLSFIAMGILATCFSYSSDSPIKFVVWGVPILGVIFTVRGISKIIG